MEKVINFENHMLTSIICHHIGSLNLQSSHLPKLKSAFYSSSSNIALTISQALSKGTG